MSSSRDASPIECYLASLHERFLAIEDGAVASYIPELAEADPRWFGISIATADGHVYEVGDTRQAAGMGFGEGSIVEGSVRTAFVRADSPSVCWVLKRTALESLDVTSPDLKIRLLENFLRSATRIIGRFRDEVLAQRL